MSIGETVLGTVRRVEEYGVYLDHEDDKLLVLIVDVSFERVPDLKSRYRIGEQLPVKILRFVAETGEYVGSIRDAAPAP